MIWDRWDRWDDAMDDLDLDLDLDRDEHVLSREIERLESELRTLGVAIPARPAVSVAAAARHYEGPQGAYECSHSRSPSKTTRKSRSWMATHACT